MQPHRAMCLSLIGLGLAACALSGGPPNGPATEPVHGRLILIAKEEPAQQQNGLLDLVRLRLPLVVHQGRFMTDEGVITTCVYARRSSGRAGLARDSTSLPSCPVLGVYLDGVRLGYAGSLLGNMRASDFESVELLSASDAMQRYGLSAEGGEVLVLWSRGRGPHARPPVM